jgi:hypothetical protein
MYIDIEIDINIDIDRYIFFGPGWVGAYILLARVGETSVLLDRCAVLCRALPTETYVESGTSQGKSGTSGNLSNSGFLSVGSKRGRSTL